MILENSPNVTYVNNNKINKFLNKNKFKKIKNKIESKINLELGVVQVKIHGLENESLIVDKMFKDYEKNNETYPVTKSGLKYDEECQEIGSMRFCTNSSNLADFLNDVIQESDAFPSNLNGDEYVGVSPYFRIMKYKNGGMHYPHYDSDYKFLKPNDDLYTAYSLVMYLSECETGEIAFIEDKTIHAKDKSDWERQCNENEIVLKVKPQVGNIVLFPHTICHAVMEYTEEKERVMIRGDLIFKKSKGKNDE